MNKVQNKLLEVLKLHIQEEKYREIASQFLGGTFGHTHLFHGKMGFGNLFVVLKLTLFIHCEDKKELQPCFACPRCRQFFLYSNQDLEIVIPSMAPFKGQAEPLYSLFWETISKNIFINSETWGKILGEEKDSGNSQLTIYVEDIEKVTSKVFIKSQKNTQKTFLFWNIDKMPPLLSNKLLKTFEEPPPNNYFFLLSENLDYLLPTIKSRCIFHRLKGEPDDIFMENTKQLFLPTERIEHFERVVQNAKSDYLKVFWQVEQGGGYHMKFEMLRLWLRACYLGEFDLMNKTVQSLAKENRGDVISTLSFLSELLRHCVRNKIGKETQEIYSEEEIKFIKNFSRTMGFEIFERSLKEVSNSVFEIRRNGNLKTVLASLSNKLFLIFSGKGDYKFYDTLKSIFGQ